MTDTQAQLISSIDQQIENLSFLDEELTYHYESNYYDDNDEPIVELFTPDLLKEVTDWVNKLDN
jgi:hypothetical protein